MDFLTPLMDAQDFGRPLDTEELRDMCFVLVAAGLDTTSIASMKWALIALDSSATRVVSTA
jgi:cytochrome P450